MLEIRDEARPKEERDKAKEFIQVLYGNEYFRREFGKESVDYMLPDCFGFPASMPSIWAHAGLRGFSTQKLTLQLPSDLGAERIDGQLVLRVMVDGKQVSKNEYDVVVAQKSRATVREGESGSSSRLTNSPWKSIASPFNSWRRTCIHSRVRW